MTDQEFKNEVMGYKGKYPELELKKFIKYFVERKHFSTFVKFDIPRRLANWFSPKRAKKFKEKTKESSQEDIQMQILKNSLGKFNPLR